MTRTSWTEPRPRSASASSRRLLATLAVAVLALGGAAAAELESTGALFQAEAAVGVEGFQTQPVCGFEDYITVQERLVDLGPVLHWGFAPGQEPWDTAGGAPEAVTPGTTLACDEGELMLAPGRWVAAAPGAAAPLTAVLVAGTPAAAGTALVLAEPAGAGLEVRVTSTTASLWAWDGGGPAVELGSVPLEPGVVHVLALGVDGTTATLWCDGASLSEELPVAPASPAVALGAAEHLLPGAEPVSAAFTATELAVLPGATSPAVLAELFVAATSF